MDVMLVDGEVFAGIFDDFDAVDGFSHGGADIGEDDGG